MDSKESNTNKFVKGASAGAVAGAMASIFILDEINTCAYPSSKWSRLPFKTNLKIVLGSTVAAAAVVGLLSVISKPDEKKSWEEKLEGQDPSTNIPTLAR
jgi:hypothetical protein